MGRSRRQTDAAGQDHTDSREGGEEYTTVDKNYAISIGCIRTLACMVVPLIWGIFQFDARFRHLEAKQGQAGWDREQSIRQWEAFSDLNPSNIVPDPRCIGYHDPKSGQWIRPSHSPAIQP